MLCGFEFKQITSSGHLRKHNIDIGEYKKLFPEAEVISKEICELRSKLTNDRILKGIHFVPFRDIKGLARKIHDQYKIKDRRDFEYVCIRCGIKKYAECRSTAKKRKFCSNKCRMLHIQEHDELLKEFSRKVSRATTGIPKRGGYSRARGGVREDIGHYVRSGWEADICRIFIYYNKPYEYEKYVVKLQHGKNSLTWIIDFIDTQKHISNGLIEVKGWWDKKSKLKLKLLKKQYPDIYKRLTIIDFHKMKDLIVKYKGVINGWESSK